MMNRVAVALLALAAMACGAEPPLVQLAEARELSADLRVQFVTAADAANKTIMSDTSIASAAFVRQADAAKNAVESDIAALQPLLRDLEYTPEGELLRAFTMQFEEYRKLDHQILGLAAENTNREAQRLSFGAGQTEADAFRDELAVFDHASGAEAWHVAALAATAVAAVREIQALQAPHIAEALDPEMTRMEERMAIAEKAARSSLRALAPLVGGAGRPRLAAASSAFDRFMKVNVEITALSRRNTNVRSLALALNEKGKITASCEDGLRQLRDALAQRGFKATR